MSLFYCNELAIYAVKFGGKVLTELLDAAGVGVKTSSKGKGGKRKKKKRRRKLVS